MSDTWVESIYVDDCKAILKIRLVPVTYSPGDTVTYIKDEFVFNNCEVKDIVLAYDNYPLVTLETDDVKTAVKFIHRFPTV